MAQVIKTVTPSDTVHTIEVTERELSMLTSLLGQLRHGVGQQMFHAFKAALTAPRVMIVDRHKIPAIDFES